VQREFSRNGEGGQQLQQPCVWASLCAKERHRCPHAQKTTGKVTQLVLQLALLLRELLQLWLQLCEVRVQAGSSCHECWDEVCSS
jgi:hypothetical protein